MFTLSDGHRYTFYIILCAYLGTCSHYLMCTGTCFTLSDGCKYMFYMCMGIGTCLTLSDGQMYMFKYLMDIGTCLTYLTGIGTRLHNLRFGDCRAKITSLHFPSLISRMAMAGSTTKSSPWCATCRSRRRSPWRYPVRRAAQRPWQGWI